ncbi:hypothetical protein BC827DRAFT_197200 [Russula dissimulans]|nr:hypothetical protein BC827DRAFT_197200 [Russula dissimulans]
MAMQVNESERPASTSGSGSAPVAVNLIRQPTAFAAPDPASTSSSGPSFYNTNNKTPIHATVSADGTSVFSIEGYVNTPELSAGHRGGLSQGLLANGPYKSLFRARSESRGSNKPSAATAAAAVAADAALHVLADAAQSPEALSPVSRASPALAPAHAQARAQAQAQAQTSVPAPPPSHTSRKRRKPSPLATSSPVLSAAQPSSAASTNASSSHVVESSLPPPPAQEKPRGGSAATHKANYNHKETAQAVPRVAAQPLPSNAQPNGNAIDELCYVAQRHGTCGARSSPRHANDQGRSER